MWKQFLLAGLSSRFLSSLVPVLAQLQNCIQAPIEFVCLLREECSSPADVIANAKLPVRRPVESVYDQGHPGDPSRGEDAVTKRKSKSSTVLPPIVITTEEARPLNVGMTLCPREAMFLAREMNRASMVPDNADLRRVVHMGSQVV